MKSNLKAVILKGMIILKEFPMIYLLEDDANIRNFVEYALKGSGFAAAGFEKPSLFWEAIKEE